jgi:hypothetical protein
MNVFIQLVIILSLPVVMALSAVWFLAVVPPVLRAVFSLVGIPVSFLLTTEVYEYIKQRRR